MAFQWKLSLFLAIAYLVTGYVGLMLPMFGNSITLIWMPTGISVGMLFRYGYGCWPGIAAGAFLTNLAVGSPAWVAIGIALGNTLGPLLVTDMLKRLSFDREFQKQRDILVLALSGVLGMVVPATLGVLVLSLAGYIQNEYKLAWLTWWWGDTMGVVIAAPIVLVLSHKELRFLSQRLLEFGAWLLAVLLLCLLVFVVNGRSDNPALALAFLTLPLMVWAGLRLGATGTSVGVILLAVSAALGIANGTGPFKEVSPAESVMLLGLFILTCVVIGWLVRILNVAHYQVASLYQLTECFVYPITGKEFRLLTSSESLSRFLLSKNLARTGLGLAIVYGIVQKCRGNIRVESIVGQATTVTILLPLSS